MKFNEKLIELRKKQGLSQEELGYKLNVTRQTVSKWELGQTTPEMDKLVEMGKIFNVSVDELINESEITTNVNPIIEDQPIGNKTPRDRKVLILIVIALVVVMIFIGIKIFSAFSPFNLFSKTTDKVFGAQEEIIGEESKNFFEKIFSLLNKEIDKQLADEETNAKDFENIQQNVENLIQNSNDKFNISRFNGTLELFKGSNSGMQLKRLLEEVITNNKTEERKIIVKYNEIETQNVDEIQNLKLSVKDSNNFEVTFDYDEEGYINKATIEKVVSEFEINSFNNSFEIYAGSENGMIVTTVLDKIITSNKTEDRKITVKYKTTETQDENEIKKIKRNFGNFDKCEITYEYDAEGFINKAIIERL